MHAWARRKWLPVMLLVVLLAGCASSPLGRSQLLLFSDARMEKIGTVAFMQMKKNRPTVQGTARNRYVQCVANALLSELEGQEDWEVVLFKSEQVNAFALPGGKIGIYAGLLRVAKTPGQLATVIAHEIGHVLAEHSNERMSMHFATQMGMQLLAQLAGQSLERKRLIFSLLGIGVHYGITLPYSRTQEAEADLIGLKLMARAGFDPRQAVELWRNMMSLSAGSPPEFLSTHPSDIHRIHNLQDHMDKALRLYRQARRSGDLPSCNAPTGGPAAS